MFETSSMIVHTRIKNLKFRLQLQNYFTLLCVTFFHQEMLGQHTTINLLEFGRQNFLHKIFQLKPCGQFYMIISIIGQFFIHQY